jgi:hypothetical protein
MDSNEKFKAQRLSNAKNMDEGNKETWGPNSAVCGGNQEAERLIHSEGTCGG